MKDPEFFTSPRRDLLIRVVALSSLAVSLYYIGWRLTSTLNPDALVLSVILWAAELYGILHAGLFTFTVWAPVRRRHKPAPPGLDVDVFVTTYNESLSVVRKTLIAARGISYPHRTWVLDDGCRDEVRELAARIDVGYISRVGNEHAKAGNLNSALAITKGEFMLQLDADHVPLPHILDRLLGYFEDPRMAFVQSPQDFYNLDSFSHVVDDNGRRVWEEQRIFFDVIQPGKDRWNAVFFCGSCGVLRRAALDDIGGFATQTVVEDMETSILLHERGWKSAYVTESLAYGLSPGSMPAYQVQRLRWATGSMQILRKFKPLTRKGLTWAQRLCYFDSCTGYLDGVQRAILLAAPFVYFLTGVFPLKAVDSEFIARFFPYVFLQIVAFELLSRGRGYVLLSERYSMIRFPVYVRALLGFFANKPIVFQVTPKGSGPAPVRAYVWQLLIVVAAPLMLLWATVAHTKGWIDYGAAGWRSGAFLLNSAWLAWNAVFAWQVVQMARRMRQREDYRVKDEMPMRFQVVDRTGIEAAPSIGIAHEVSASSLVFMSAMGVSPGERVRTMLPLTTGDREVTGEVVSREEVVRGGAEFSAHICRLLDVDLETQTLIELHCLHHAVPGRQERFFQRRDLFEDGLRFMSERRREFRRVVRLPAQVRLQDPHGSWHPAVLEELGDRGAQVILDHAVDCGSVLDFQVPGVEIQGRGSVVQVRPLRTPLARRWVLGLRLEGDGEASTIGGRKRTSGVGWDRTPDPAVQNRADLRR